MATKTHTQARDPGAIFTEVSKLAQREERLAWAGTFGDYLEMIAKKPGLVRSAYRYLYDVVTSRPDFFRTGDDALFGMESTLSYLVDLLKAGAEGLDLRKRIILLLGPVGGGKSTLVMALKRGLEDYSKSDQGAVYAIADCPMREEPLHLIPKEVRPRVAEMYGIKIEGELCPHCLRKYGEGLEDLSQVPVRRIFFSENSRVGIGTFSPSDPKSQDMTELVGSVDFSKLGEYGVASDPRAYRFDGELNVANRGLIEFIELLKVDERFLYVLLSLAQERVIKTGRFANISADLVVVAHTNEAEYRRFVGKKENEALLDRMVVIPVPYNLKLADEVRIYDKLIRQSELADRNEVHISPHALWAAAMFAVRSRLEEKPGLSAMQKLKIYDGQIEGHDVEALRDEFPREGMDGISPRYVIDCLSMALVREGKSCLTPMDVLTALDEGLEFHPHTRSLSEEETARLKDIIGEVLEEYKELARQKVLSVFGGFSEKYAQDLFAKYLVHASAWCLGTEVQDPASGRNGRPDEAYMRSIEELIMVPEATKREFRQELMALMARSGSRESFDYKTYGPLREAVEKKALIDSQRTGRLGEKPVTVEDVQALLMSAGMYCRECATELIQCGEFFW